MDQDGDGTPGEPGQDAYSATFAVALPDLVLDSVTPSSSSGVFGSALSLTWKVHNPSGSDAVGPWTDRVWLVRPGLDDLLLAGPVRSESLAAGDRYEVTLPVTPPLA